MKLWGAGGTIGPGAVTRAAAVCHCCGAGREGRLILHTVHKKRELQAFSVVRSNFSRISISGCHVSVPLKEATVLLHAGCPTAREGQLESMLCSSLCCPGAWCDPCTAGGGEQDGSTDGGLPPASLLLRRRVVAIGLGTAGCLPWRPALISVLHCLCCIDRPGLWSQQGYHCHDMMGRFSGGAAPEA